MKNYLRVLASMLSIIIITQTNIVFWSEMLHTKTNACSLKDGYYEQYLNTNYPGYTSHVFEFIKKQWKLLYLVHLGSDSQVTKTDLPTTTKWIYAYEYDCKSKKARELWPTFESWLYLYASLDGASSKYIVANTYIWDGCGSESSMKKIIIDRKTKKHTFTDFTTFFWYWELIWKLWIMNPDRLGIEIFWSTTDGNIFNTTLVVHPDDWCGDAVSKYKVVVDLRKQTIKLK